MPQFATQSGFPVRFEWGMQGLLNVANAGRVAVVVDVLSFSTCVDIACARGAQVFPFAGPPAQAPAFAQARSALLAGKRSQAGLSLSPASLLEVQPGLRLVLPSPNGSTLSASCTAPVVLAGCLRNARAVAHFAARQGGPVTVVAAGERWDDGTLRPALEDLLGAGALIHHLPGARSPEAMAAEAAFLGLRDSLPAVVARCASGIELDGRGHGRDVQLACELNASLCVPRLVAGAYIDVPAAGEPGSQGS